MIHVNRNSATYICHLKAQLSTCIPQKIRAPKQLTKEARTPRSKDRKEEWKVDVKDVFLDVIKLKSDEWKTKSISK